MIPNPTLSPKRKKWAEASESESQMSPLSSQHCMWRGKRDTAMSLMGIVPFSLCTPPLRKLNGVQSVWGLSWNFSSPFLNLIFRYLFLFLFYLKIGILVRSENTVALEVDMGLSTM